MTFDKRDEPRVPATIGPDPLVASVSSPSTALLLASLLSAKLFASCDFETVSGHLLQAIFEVIAPVLRSRRGDAAGHMLRATIHYRPDDGYRRLWGKEFGSAHGGTPAANVTSITAWRWVARRRCPVAIDVGSRLLRVFEGGPPRLIRDEPAGLLDTGQTCQRLHDRDVDYLYVLPVRRPRGQVDGMVSIEMRCPSEIGDSIASECGQALQLLVDLAAPHLASLPLAPLATAPEVDEFLPVVGAETAGLIDLLRVFSRLPETILISGPTGVGKSRLARYCHERSTRKGKPFVTVDLLACPEDLQMAQLVGWKRGAFTGADKDSPGAIQRAEGGTLFLDEIDKLSLQAQAGLLRLLEDRAWRPVGDSGEDRRADVRFIVGTNADLRAAADSGKFRHDLYWRIAVLTVRVPPLSRRIDEVAEWSAYMLKRCHQNGSPGLANDCTEVRLDGDAIQVLQAQPWPGNLRQLDNVIRRAYAYSLMEEGRSPSSVVVTRSHIERAVSEDRSEPPPGEASVLVRQMRAAARAYAREVKRRASTETPLLLESADAFRGFVVEATLKRFGNNKEEAFDALGLGAVVKDRNHHRMIKRELEAVARFLSLFDDKAAGGQDPDG